MLSAMRTTDLAMILVADGAVGIVALSGGGCRSWKDKEIGSCEDVVEIVLAWIRIGLGKEVHRTASTRCI